MKKSSLSDDDLEKIAGSILANQIALNLNEGIKHTSIYKSNLKYTLNNTINTLIKTESKDFDTLEKFTDQKFIDSGLSVLSSMIQLLTSIGFMKFGDIAQLLFAYTVDPEFMISTATSVTDNNKEENQ